MPISKEKEHNVVRDVGIQYAQNGDYNLLESFCQNANLEVKYDEQYLKELIKSFPPQASSISEVGQRKNFE